VKLQQLRYLIAIADNGLNITAAANHLYTSQPGVSKQLRLLEEELGVQLFVRHGRSLTAVTTAGEQTIAHARLIMREVAGIRALARGFIDEAQSDLDEPLNNRLHLFGSRLDKPGARRRSATFAKRRF
jgi:LysR family transcriptional regulator, cys regulon transcriptional activator